MRAVQERRVLNIVLIAGLVIATTVLLRLSGVGIALDRVLLEGRFLAKERPLSGEIVFVELDARSLEELGTWPLPRRLFADLIGRLSEGGARDIVLDVDFSAASSAEDDALLARALERAGNVSLAVFRQSATAGSDAGEVTNQPIEQFRDAAWPVVVMVPVESDSRIWRNLYGFDIDGTVELSAASFLGEHTGGTAGAFWLDYSIAVDRLERFSLVDVLEEKVPPGVFYDKKVIVGASAQELRDLFPVPVYGVLPGSMIQALGAETLLQGRALEQKGEWIAVFAAFVIFVLLLMTGIEGWVLKAFILALCAVALEFLAFSLQEFFPVIVPTGSAHIVFLSAAAGLVFWELGFHKFLLQIATIRQRNSERMLGLVLDDSFDAIVVVKSGGTISAANQTAKILFQCSELVGRNARTVLPPGLVEEALAVLVMPPEGKPVPKTLAAVQNNGSRRYIEYVVTRSEKAVAKSGLSKDVAIQAVACLTCRDVTVEWESSERLSYLARYDGVTGLLNRNGFEERLEQITRSARETGAHLCVIQFAIVNLDQIIASLGFSYGDQLRHAVAVRLQNHLSRRTDWSTLSADVFACVFECAPGRETTVIETVKQVVGEDYNIEGARISVQLNFGFLISRTPEEPEVMLKKSSNALARVRRDTQCQMLAFRPELDAQLQRRRFLETELFKAIVRDEIYLAYQPLVDLSDNSIVGVEALLRWEHRELGPISPVEFIPLAEENGYIVELGAWALNRGMKEALAWSYPLRLSVNISAVQFSRGNLIATVRETLERTGFPAGRLDLEITESLFIDDSLDLQRNMNELRAFGCSFSLDDFGTGYSSLGYLPKYPFAKIKLDKSFVRESIADRRDKTVIEAVLHLAKGYDMSVVVEGIETAEQAETLRQMGCQLGQGYFFGRPMSALHLSEYLQRAA